MKKFLLFLAVVLGISMLVGTGQAKTGVIVNRGTTSTLFFATNGKTVPTPTVLSQVVGPKVLVKKIRFFPNTTAGSAITTVDLWDIKSDGLTYTAGTKWLGTLYGLVPAIGTGPYVIDFTQGSGDINVLNSPKNGLVFDNYPAVICSGTNSINAQVEYELVMPTNTVFPGVTP